MDTSIMWTRLLAGGCLICAAVTTAPQTRALLRRRDPDGVSGPAVVFHAVTEGAWVLYALVAHRLAAAPADVLYAVGAVALLAAMAHSGGFQPRHWAWGGWWAVTLGLSALGGHAAGLGNVALGELLAGAVLVEGVPQAVTVWRSPTATGLSVGTQAWLLGGAFLWGAYGLLVGDTPFMTYGALQAAVTTPVLLRLVALRSRNGWAGARRPEATPRLALASTPVDVR